MGAGTFGGAEDGPQIVGVGDLVADHQQRRFSLVGGALEDALHRHVFPNGSQRDHALMGVGAAHVVQLAAIRLHHHDARVPGLGGDMAQGFIRVPLGQIDLVNGRSGAEGFNDRVAAFNYAVGLRLRHGAALFGGCLFFHRKTGLSVN